MPNQSTLNSDNTLVQSVIYVFKSAEDDENLLAQLYVNPAQQLTSGGLNVQLHEQDQFNRFFHNEIGTPEHPLKLWMNDPNRGPLEEVAGIGCTLCKIACFAIAAAIVAAGAAAIAVLTVKSGLVTKLAAFASKDPEATLEFVKKLAPVIGHGINAVAAKICEFTGACE